MLKYLKKNCPIKYIIILYRYGSETSEVCKDFCYNDDLDNPMKKINCFEGKDCISTNLVPKT